MESWDAGRLLPWLRGYGYRPLDCYKWESRGEAEPSLELRITGHAKQAGHTHYHLSCTLNSPRGDSWSIAWSVPRQLSQLREGLHDPVKAALGDKAYAWHFAKAPFASRLGPPGTTSR